VGKALTSKLKKKMGYVLGVADPSFRVLFRQLMVGVGCLELFIAFFRLFTNEKQLGPLAIASLGTSFVG